ncbi:MAG: RusA family crossover junction endodeoxyribonuclease [Planctomycetes bacterium]|nr:RusA family crossover junction endodeoxyribonuclease [Planctomycetota bacterium]
MKKPPIDRMRYNRKNGPACKFIIPLKPKSTQSESKEKYKMEIHERALKAMNYNSLILTDDIEVEIAWRSVEVDHAVADIDNIIKPILDAMNGAVYKDDKQIRSLLVLRIPKGNRAEMSGYAEDFLEILENVDTDSVQIAIYSDSQSH